MCICNKNITTPFCNKGFCVSPRRFILKEFKTSNMFERANNWHEGYRKNDIVKLNIMTIHTHVTNRKIYLKIEFPDGIFFWVEESSIEIYKIPYKIEINKDMNIKELENIIMSNFHKIKHQESFSILLQKYYKDMEEKDKTINKLKNEIFGLNELIENN